MLKIVIDKCEICGRPVGDKGFRQYNIHTPEDVKLYHDRCWIKWRIRSHLENGRLEALFTCYEVNSLTPRDVITVLKEMNVENPERTWRRLRRYAELMLWI